jgi:thiamine biosynthesis lipoprotein
VRQAVRRARPLLGTRVEIAVDGLPVADMHAAVNAAFATIERVHTLMSFQAQDSDIGRLNREAFSRPVRVDPETWHVLDLALVLSDHSHGTFDIIAPSGRKPRVRFRDIELLPGDRVRFRRELQIDLGGIAKGYAVDRAIDCLRTHHVPSGLVNAGGDLRVFGEKPTEVLVRDPLRPDYAGAAASIREAALATTAQYSALWQDRVAGAIVDPRSCRNAMPVRSASVRAATCLLADALAKSLYLLGLEAADLLAQYDADGFLLEAGSLRLVGG